MTDAERAEIRRLGAVAGEKQEALLNHSFTNIANRSPEELAEINARGAEIAAEASQAWAELQGYSAGLAKRAELAGIDAALKP